MVAKARKKLTAATTTSMDDIHDDDDDAHGDAVVATGNQKGCRLGLDDVRKGNDGGADHDHDHHHDDEDDDKYDTSIGHGSDARLMKPSHMIPRRNNINNNNSNSSSLHSLPSTHNHPPLPSFPLKASSSSSIPLPPLSQSNIDLLTHQHHKKKPTTKTSKSSGNSKPSSLEPHVKKVDNHHLHGHDHHDTHHHNNRIEDNHNTTTAAAVRRVGHKVHSKGHVDPPIAPTVSSTSFIRIDTNKASNHYNEHHTSDKTIPPIISIISNEHPQTLSPTQQKELERKKKAHDLLQSLYYKHVESSEDEYDDEEGDNDDDDIEGSSDALEAEYLRLREEFNRKLKLAASMNAATVYALAQSNAGRGEKKGLTDGNNDGDGDDDHDAPVSIRNCDRFDDNRADSNTDGSSAIDDGLDRHHHHHRGSEENNRSSPFVHTSGSVTTSYSENNRQISTSELLKVWQMEDRMMDEHRVDDDADRIDDDINHLGSPDHDEDSHYKGHNADEEDEDEDVDDHAIKTINSSRSSKSSRQSTATAAATAFDDMQCLALLQRLSQKIEL